MMTRALVGVIGIVAVACAWTALLESQEATDQEDEGGLSEDTKDGPTPLVIHHGKVVSGPYKVELVAGQLKINGVSTVRKSEEKRNTNAGSTAPVSDDARADEVTCLVTLLDEVDRWAQVEGLPVETIYREAFECAKQDPCVESVALVKHQLIINFKSGRREYFDMPKSTDKDNPYKGPPDYPDTAVTEPTVQHRYSKESLNRALELGCLVLITEYGRMCIAPPHMKNACLTKIQSACEDADPEQGAKDLCALFHFPQADAELLLESFVMPE